MSASSPSKMVVVQTSYLGDVVLATPVFAALKGRWPGAELTAIVRPESAAVLRGHPHVDAVLVYDKRGRDRGIRGLLRMAACLRLAKFDLAVGLQKSLRTSLLLALARVPLRVGFRESAGRFLYHRAVSTDPTRHSVERQLAVLSLLEVPFDAAGARPLLRVTDEARREMRRCMDEVGAGSMKRYVVLAPGSAWATKRWTEDGYAGVARELNRRGYGVVYVGAPNEAETTHAVRRNAGCGVSLAGKTDTAALAAVIEGASAVICNDSAALHVAQALGVPVVTVFGPTSPRQGFGPRRQPAAVVEREDLACRPCSRHGGARCPINTHECMRDIPATRVLAALAALWAQNQASADARVQAG